MTTRYSGFNPDKLYVAGTEDLSGGNIARRMECYKYYLSTFYRWCGGDTISPIQAVGDMTVSSGYVYVVNESADEIVRYDIDDQSYEDDDYLDLSSAGIDEPVAISKMREGGAAALLVIDADDLKAYGFGGGDVSNLNTRNSDLDFDLDSDNTDPIAIDTDLFDDLAYVLDGDGTIYVYEAGDGINTPTATPVSTNTPTPTSTATPTPTATNTPTPVPTHTPTNTPVPTFTPVPVNTNTPVPANTNTPVPNTFTPTPEPADTFTPTPFPDDTATPIPYTSTPVPANTNTPVPINTNTPVPLPTHTPPNLSLIHISEPTRPY